MRASSTGVVMALLLVSIGCGQAASPISPSAGSIAGSGLVASRGSSAASTVTNVPMKGTIEGTFTVAGDFPIVSVHLQAEGNATHFGRFTLDFAHSLDLRSGTNVPPSIATLTAANGDTWSPRRTDSRRRSRLLARF